jgi:hypothetical protein
MAVPLSVGTTGTKSIFFNSGILTINGKQIGDVQDVTINLAKTEKNYYALGSKVKRAVRTSNVDSNGTFNLTGALYRELIKNWFSSSSPVSGGLKYTVKDGKEDAMTVVITTYEDDDTDKWIQYEFVGAVLLNHSLTLTQQEFASVQCEIACETINAYLSTTLTTT